MKYIKEVFDVGTFDQAKHVVLTSDPNDPEKFTRETNFLIDKIKNLVELNSDSVVLDFGCGMGRLSKELINFANCTVIGLDISPSMLMFAKLYTANLDKFIGTHNYNIPNSVDLVLSIFALQHAEDPKKEIDNLISVLKPNAKFILVNEPGRFVPNDIDKNNYIIWKDDGFNVFEYLESKLKKLTTIPYISSRQNIVVYQK